MCPLLHHLNRCVSLGSLLLQMHCTPNVHDYIDPARSPSDMHFVHFCIRDSGGRPIPIYVRPGVVNNYPREELAPPRPSINMHVVHCCIWSSDVALHLTALAAVSLRTGLSCDIGKVIFAVIASPPPTTARFYISPLVPTRDTDVPPVLQQIIPAIHCRQPERRGARATQQNNTRCTKRHTHIVTCTLSTFTSAHS
jgi:hypothetical protein